MDTLVLLIKLALALWFFYTVGLYAWRRQRNRQASASFSNVEGTGRELTAQEQATLRSYLANPQASAGMTALTRGGRAFPLDGEFVRHGIRLHLGSTMHDTLAGVDVRMPYDAKDFLQPRNTAEVVLTERFAVVITLNERFDIAAGRARAVAANLHKFAAAHPDTPLPEIDSALAAADLAMMGFELLGRRDETMAERIARRATSLVDDIIIGTTLALALLAVVFGSSSPDDASVYWMGIGFGLLAVSAWRWARSAKLPGAQTVHRLRGRLGRTALTDAPGSAAAMFMLGRRFSLKAPFHWTRFINPPALEPVEFEIRVGDGSLVRYRESLSIEAEAVRFPRKPARSVKGVGLAAATALCFALIGYSHIGVDFDRARALITATSAPNAVLASSEVANPASAEEDAATATPTSACCLRDACDSERWAALRTAVVVVTLVLVLTCALLALVRRMADAARLRRLGAFCEEQTRR